MVKAAQLGACGSKLLADGQLGIGRWKEKGGKQEKCQGQDTMEAGQSRIGNESKSVFGESGSCVSLFLFLVVFVFL
jgi:hypothetical protein